MPVSADLLKVLAEDPKSLEQQLGCMAGLFQIFDRQGLGRRYGSKRVSNAGSGQSQPTSACETPRHDHHGRHNNPYWMFEEESLQRISGDSSLGARNNAAVETREPPHHRPAYSDSSEIFTKSFETPTESRTSPDEKSNLDQSPIYSEESVVGGLASYFNDPPSREISCVSGGTSRYTSFEDGDPELQCKKLNVLTVPVRVANFRKQAPGTQQSSMSDIRDIVRAPFEHDHQRSTRNGEHLMTKPRLSVDGSHGGNHQQLKNLPRSSSVDGKDHRLRLSVDGRGDAARLPTGDNLPRSSSVGGRGASRMLADWKDGLRSSSASPRLTGKERDALLNNKQKAPEKIVPPKYTNVAPEGRDVTRLTVELKEGPRLSVSVDDRRASVDGKVPSPRPISRFRDVVPCEQLPSTNFKESLRAADIKEFLRGEKKFAGREGHRFSVDGTRDAPRACIAPRLSVDGRDTAGNNNNNNNNETTTITVLHKLNGSHDGNAPQFCRQTSGRKASNVVARLMGLDELPTPSTPPLLPTRLKLESPTELYDQEYLHSKGETFSPPPPPSPPDDYDYAHRSSDQEPFHHVRGHRFRRHKTESIHDHFSSNHHQQQQHHPELNCNQTTTTTLHPDIDITPAEEDGHAVVNIIQPSEGRDQQRRQLAPRKSPQGRRSLWHIFDAMQLKGLLNGSSRRKQSEAVRLRNLKLTEENECQQAERRSQSLPPRLSSDQTIRHDTTSVPGSQASQAAFPKSMGSGLEHEAHANGGAAEELSSSCVVVMKPIITRSVSYKSQAAAPPSVAPIQQPCGVVVVDVARKCNPDEDTSSKNITRALSKSGGGHQRAAVNEAPVQQEEPTTAQLMQVAESACSHNNASSGANVIVRQTRKERGAARVTSKSFSDAPQGERDSSPRLTRAATQPTTPHAQERPARSCSPRSDYSSSVSPRNADGVRLMDAGKVRRKPFAVKDREESKASLAHLRANATKQEFLKERASGDPDTPRLLRRSSSESKLLAKISSEKPVNNTDNIIPSPTKAGGGRSASPPPSMSTLLRSKRPPVSTKDKSPMKTRPTSALGLKPVAKPKERTVPAETTQIASHVNTSPAATKSVPGAAAAAAAAAAASTTTAHEHQQPAENMKTVRAPSRCAASEVRATHGGALDQSGDAGDAAPHANARERGCESKFREKAMEIIDEGVKTPRGVSIKKIDFSEDAQAEVAEQPSPVSVLDNSHFDEELTPSPKAGKSSVVSLQEPSLRSDKDRPRWSSARFLDLNLEETTTTITPSSRDSAPEETETDAPSVTTVREKSDKPTHVPVRESAPKNINIPPLRRVCLRDADEERAYVHELVNASSELVMDPTLFDHLETKRGCTTDDDDEKDALDRRILFDCVNEVLERLLATQLTTCMRALGHTPRTFPARGHELVPVVLAQLGDIPCGASDDVCDTVYMILQKDLLRGRGAQQWSDYHKELEEVGVAVERMILKDLIEETVRELMSACLFAHSLPVMPESSRRQLFA